MKSLECQAKKFAFYSVDNQSHESLLQIVDGFMKSHQFCVRRIRKKGWRGCRPRRRLLPKSTEAVIIAWNMLMAKIKAETRDAGTSRALGQ